MSLKHKIMKIKNENQKLAEKRQCEYDNQVYMPQYLPISILTGTPFLSHSKYLAPGRTFKRSSTLTLRINEMITIMKMIVLIMIIIISTRTTIMMVNNDDDKNSNDHDIR